MRELAFVSFKIVDTNDRIQPEGLQNWFTPDYPDPVAANAMRRLERPATADTSAVTQTSDVGAVEFVPVAQMTMLRLEPCNPDGVLAEVMDTYEREFIMGVRNVLGDAGLKLLDQCNTERGHLNDMSKTLCGDGVELTGAVQFYVSFNVVRAGERTYATLEGALDLSKVDSAIDKTIFQA